MKDGSAPLIPSDPPYKNKMMVTITDGALTLKQPSLILAA
uniref:Uncharacterized protein n=1 Tax=Anguilla anguilla TaxID=7936 RepID=A0A0E9WPI2_ANGAN